MLFEGKPGHRQSGKPHREGVEEIIKCDRVHVLPDECTLHQGQMLSFPSYFIYWVRDSDRQELDCMQNEASMIMFMCVCVKEREKEKYGERDTERDRKRCSILYMRLP